MTRHFNRQLRLVLEKKADRLMKDFDYIISKMTLRERIVLAFRVIFKLKVK